MKKFILLLTFVLMTSGCATTEEGTLQLENVLDYKAAMALKKNQEIEELRKAEMQTEQILIESSLDTPELSLLDLSQHFVRYENEDIEKFRKEFGEDRIPPFAEVIWRDLDSSILVVAGKVKWDADFVTSKTRQEFGTYLKNTIGKQYNQFLKDSKGTGAAVEVLENGSIVILKLTEKYLEEGRWLSDERLFLVYQPDYRLNIFVSKRADDDELVYRYFQEQLMKFEYKLLELYPEGAQFTPPDEL